MSRPHHRNPRTKADVAARLNALAGLLAGGSYSEKEAMAALPEYHDLHPRTFQRDIVSLAKQCGQDVIAERHPGSRWVSYRLADTPARAQPIPERPKINVDTIEIKDVPRPALADRLIMTTGQAAEWLGITPRQVKYLCKAGRIPAQTPTGIYLILGEDLVKFAATQRKRGRNKMG